MVASYLKRGKGRLAAWHLCCAAAIGIVMVLMLSNVGFAQRFTDDNHPWDLSGDPTNDLPGTTHDFAHDALPPGTPLVPTADPQPEGCLACHDGPDLNHDESTFAGYTVSSTVGTYHVLIDYIPGDIGDPTENADSANPGLVGEGLGRESGICMDCHDGTVPLDAFDGSVNPLKDGSVVGPIDPTADGYFGIDLRHHHPVSFAYPPDSGPDIYNLNPSTGGTGSNGRGDPSDLFVLKDGNLMIECVTCHNQHTHYQENNPLDQQSHGSYRTGHLVRMSSICFFCHPRYQDDVQDRNPSPYGVDMGDHDGDPSTPDVDLKTTANGHHLPGRNDPFGLARGAAGATWDGTHLVNNQKFACVMCHNIDGAGTYGHGHNSACTKCHFKWVPDPLTSPAPTDPSAKGHHGLNRGDPLGTGQCYLCHADPVTGKLTGTQFGDITTPSCGECHFDPWSAAVTGDPITVNIGDYEGTTGEAVNFIAEVMVAGTNTAYTEDITYQWYFGDGTVPTFPVTVKTNGSVEISHVFAASPIDDNGTPLDPSDDFPIPYVGYVSVTAEGMDGPVIQEFEIVVTDPPPPDPVDAWTVAEDPNGTPSDPSDDITFDITFQTAPGSTGDVLTGEKKTAGGATSLAFGTKMGGVIYWIDMVFDMRNWGVGNTYFANIGGGEMTGVVITPAGTFHTFTAEEK